MSGYPGAPPFGGQYSNVPFGGPFPPNFAFNNMIPPPPSFGHQQPSFPPNQIPTPGPMPYGNAIAYQNNAQHHQQQLGQVPFPPQPTAPFHAPFGSYNNYNPYAPNPYYQNPFAETTVAQQTQNGTVRGQPLTTWNAPVQDSNKSAQKQIVDTQTSSPGRTIVDAAITSQQKVASPHVSLQLDGPGSAIVTPKDTSNRQAVTSSNETSRGQTPIQMGVPISDEPVSGLRPAANGTRKSSSTSDQSFDPYSGIMSQTPGDTVDATKTLSLSLENNPISTLPGLEPDDTTSSQSEMEITREQKKTLAIQAIQDLASRKIGFDQISKENIEVELLKELYLESGVPLVLPTDVQTEVVKPAANTSKKPSSSLSLKKAAPVSADIPTITAVPNFNLPIVSVTNTKSTNPPAQVSTIDTARKSATLAKDINESTPTSANPIRQDYLAKLQVAKEAVKNKASQPPVLSLAQERSSYLAKLQAAKEAVKQSSTQKPSLTETQSTPQQDNKALSVPIEIPAPKTDNNPDQIKASIDAKLIQKLEALRKTQSSATPSIITPSMPSAAPISSKPQSFRDPTSALAEQPSNTQELLAAGLITNVERAKDTEVSFFVSSDMRGFQGLPGLPGLTTEPLPAVPTSLNDYQITSDTAQSVQLATTPTLSNQTHDQQTSSETKQSRKRPVASDFIESPPSKLPRVSVPESTSLVIDISEDEGEIQNSDNHLHDSRNDTRAAYEQAGPHNIPSRPEFSNRSTSYGTHQTLTPDLQAKEDAIRELRQRIIAATLRKTAKVATETPTASESATPLSTDIEQVQRLEDREAAIKLGTQELTSQEKALAAAKLQAQKHLEQIRRNQASLNAHADKTQQDADNANSNAEREQKLRRKADLESKLSSIEAVINTTEADLAQIKREQDKLLNRIQQESQARSLLMDELKELLKGLEKETLSKAADVTTSIAEPNVTPIEPEQNHAPPDKVLQVGSSGLENESDPVQLILANPTEQPPQISLSSSNVTSSLNSPHGDHVSPINIEDSMDEDGEEQMDIDNDSVDISEDEYDPGNIEITYNNSLEAGAHEASEEELTDYVDDYEPAQDIEVLPVETHIDTEPEHQDLPTSYQNAAEVDESSPAVSISPPISVYEQQHNEEDFGNSSKPEFPDPPEQIADVVPDTSLQIASTAQPSSFVSDIDTPTEHGQELSQQDGNTGVTDDHTDDKTGDKSEYEMAIDVSSSLHQHFVPYESPLAQFVSYRFHPQFPETVAGGFHSLTYNHKINPNLEFCKWELAGGVCNDPGCDSQHFKDIVLTDNNLLLQLGSVPEGATQQERDSYVSGLRNTIYAMRARGLEDVDSIAAEIVAYRRKFLKDPSSVIANPSAS